jgi:hypothetical protein
VKGNLKPQPPGRPGSHEALSSNRKERGRDREREAGMEEGRKKGRK